LGEKLGFAQAQLGPTGAFPSATWEREENIEAAGTKARPTTTFKAKQELGKTNGVPKQELGNEKKKLSFDQDPTALQV